jgi:hypothetical protein
MEAWIEMTKRDDQRWFIVEFAAKALTKMPPARVVLRGYTWSCVTD